MQARTRKCRRRKGSTLLEFALAAPLLLTLMITGFSIGMALTRMVQAGQLCRNANVLVVRGVDLSIAQNQTLVVRMAQGLGMNLPGTFNPDPNGKGVVILTKVVKVGANACAKGVPSYNGNTATCPNYNRYVIAKRLVIGNGSRWSSRCGSPGSPLTTQGDVTDYDVAMTSSNIAQNFSDTPGASNIVSLAQDEYTFVAEVFVDIQDLTIPYMMPLDTIAVRNIS